MGSSSNKKNVDVDSTSSEKKGFRGIVETLMRKFRNIGVLLSLIPLWFITTFCMGFSLVPGIFIVRSMYEWSTQMPLFVHVLAIGLGIAWGYLFYGLTLICIVPLVNFCLRLKLKPWRGAAYSFEALPWYYHNGLVYIVRYTFLEFLTPSPLCNWFYRMMGMKIGKGVVINSTNISDPSLITLGDYVTIGGSAHIIGHYAQKGFLVLAPVIIQNRANVGLKASIMGNVIVGEGQTVPPHAVLLPKTRFGIDEE